MPTLELYLYHLDKYKKQLSLSILILTTEIKTKNKKHKKADVFSFLWELNNTFEFSTHESEVWLIVFPMEYNINKN